MQKEEEYLSTIEKIIQISRELKSHFNYGELLDYDKNFNELLANLIVNHLKK